MDKRCVTILLIILFMLINNIVFGSSDLELIKGNEEIINNSQINDRLNKLVETDSEYEVRIKELEIKENGNDQMFDVYLSYAESMVSRFNGYIGYLVAILAILFAFVQNFYKRDLERKLKDYIEININDEKIVNLFNNKIEDYISEKDKHFEIYDKKFAELLKDSRKGLN